MPLRYNEHTRTLEQDEYQFALQDVDEPVLYDDIFRYGAVPKIPFNHRRVPMFPASEIWITDTTFRDGQQSLPPYTVEQIVRLYTMMHELGGPKGIIRQSEFFLYHDRDRKAVEGCLALGYRYPEVTAWIRAVSKDFRVVKEMGLKETGILTSASDYHIFLKLHKTRSQALDMYLSIVKDALSENIIPRCHFEDITRADFYGFVVPFAIELRKLSEECGIPIKIRACDTMGYGVPYPGAALPRSVPGIIYGLNHHAGIPCENLEWHGHNDFHKVIINATTAWLYGCSSANGTLLGFGERTGNPPIEGLVIEYLAMRGDDPSINTQYITEIAEYYRKDIKIDIPVQHPFVGEHFNTTLAGIHADGLIKDKKIYTIFDTEKILGVRPGVRLSSTSGAAGVSLWINQRWGLSGTAEEVDKKNPGAMRIVQWIEQEFNRGRISIISDQEMLAQVEKEMPELFKKATRRQRAGRTKARRQTDI